MKETPQKILISNAFNGYPISYRKSSKYDTLILFDEFAEASTRFDSYMKYFQEKAPEYHVIAAGSLLGIAMHQNDSFQ